MTHTAVTASPVRRRGVLITGGLVAAAIVAAALNAGVAAIAHAAGASSQFQPLHLPVYAGLTVIGVFAGAAGWAAIRARANNSRRLLRTVAPAVVLASFVPDILVGASGSQPGTSWGAIAALMVMHLVVTAVAISAYRRLLPLPANHADSRQARNSVPGPQ